MNIDILPCGSHPAPLEFPHFPTRHQALIWRNWEMVPPARLGTVLKTDETAILEAAAAMGLPVPPQVHADWLERGYLTLIRNNWHLLGYPQLLELLGRTADELARTLREEDFLWTKMGKLKPDCPPLHLRPLTPEEERRTKWVRDTLHHFFPDREKLEYRVPPFAFDRAPRSRALPCTAGASPFEFNFIHPFSVPGGDILRHPGDDPLPDQMLADYAACGVNGIWLHAILHQLYPIPGAEEFSDGAEVRLKTLRELTAKCARHGLKLYLYLNEPRGMSEAFYERLPEWRGAREDGAIASAICTSRTPAPLRWLEEAACRVFTRVPGLGGVFMITMSENATHCHARRAGRNCPYCRDRSVPDIIAEVVTAVERGVHAASPDARVIVYDWAWSSSSPLEDDPEFEYAILEKLPQDVCIMCVSEWGKKTDCGGIPGSVIDYSISQVGPSRKSMAVWHKARELGMKTAAKVQLNNSWEFSAAPYLPVPYLIREHLDNLAAERVDGLMLSWSLGGYPGGNLQYLSHLPEEAAKVFGETAAPLIEAAWKAFGEAFRHFPFHVHTIYFGPMNFGPMNLFHAEPTGYQATMIGFPYDDLTRWRSIYPEDVFEKQFRLLSDGWEKGLELLAKAGADIPPECMESFEDLRNVSVAAGCHFRSTCNQIRFVRRRGGRDEQSLQELLDILDDEIALTLTLHEIVRRDPRIGYEACNHYYYSLNDLREKLLNCETVRENIRAVHHP